MNDGEMAIASIFECPVGSNMKKNSIVILRAWHFKENG